MKKTLLLFFLMIFSLGYSQPGAGPTAPIARNSWDVLSVFSDTYTPVAGTRNYNPGWGQAGSASVVSIGGNNAWSATNLNYQGLDFGGNINATAMSTFHVDVWTANETSLQFFQINNGGGERSYTLTPLVQNSWNSYDIPITAWTSQTGFAVNALFQFKVVGSGGKTVYFDNMYFYRPATTQPPTLGAFTVPAKVVGDVPFTITPPTSNSVGAFTYTSSNSAVATVSGSTITVVGAGTSTITATQAADGIYGAGTATATLTVTVPPPPSAPTPPARNSFDVVSLYSDSYTATSGATWQAGADVLTTAGNNARYFNGFTLARLAFAATSVSAMTTLHIDVYTVNQNQLWFEINGNRKVVSSIPLNGWASFDIPLTDYVGLNLANVSFFDLNNPTGAAAPVKVVYLDNIYFYRAATDAPPTIGALTVPSPKTVGDAAFTLTNPTSNSSGAWTYSSSPAGVVTFSGNTATIVGGGTTTITATQAAVPGVYGAGTASASLVVNYAAPGASPVPPVRDAASVVSLYTGTPTTYANVRTAVQASWSTGSTTSNFSYANGSDTCIQVNNLGYFGLTGNTNFSVVGMTKLHVDIYVNSPMTTMILNLLAPADRNYSIGPLVTGWNSFDIPLTTYPGVLTDIAGIKFEQSGGTPRQIYIDNVYFYYTPITPTISNFAAVGKIMGAAPFTLNATSDSPATITYTSSNTAVATISGNTVTVVGVGTSTLTASQVASGSYAAGSLNATLTVGSDVPLTGPTAPPARNAWDKKSIYGSAYTNEAGVTFDTFGATASIADFTLADASVVKKYVGHSYSGIQVIAATGLDVAPASAGMTTLHMDVYSPNFTSMNVKLQAFNGSSVELAVPGGTSQYNWKSYDIPLSSYSTVDLAHLQYIVPVTYGQNATLYVTNVYFYRAATTQPPTFSTTFTVPAKLVGDAAFTLTPPTSNSAGAFTYSSSNTAVATITGSTVTVVGAGSSTITATQAADGTYGSGVTTATLSVTPAAAPTPIARNTWDVISLYSDAYATSSAASWGAGTDVSISGNNTRYLSGSPTYRLAFTPTNVSAMTKLHIDVYALNQSSWQFRLNDKAVTVGTPVNGWTSVDILLSAYVPLGLNLSTVSYFDFFNPNGANPNTSYVDNVYFYRDATDLPPTIGALTITSPQVLGAASFVITNPTSASSGAWSYSASPAGIVTFSGNTATIVGGGTATITATQAAVPGFYGPASTTASLVVTYPLPGASPVPPVRNAAKVVSVYTGTPAQVYANSPAYTLTRASWTGGTTANFNFANGTNTCIQVSNLGFIGLVDQTERRVSVTGMTNLHLDVYVNAPLSNLFVFLLDGADHNYSSGALVAGWNSLSIPLSAYAGTNLASIYGLKLEQNVASNTTQIYLDNIYFSNDTYYADTDGDGYGDANTTVLASTQPAGYVLDNTDCDDTNIAIYRNGVFYVDSDNDGFNNGGPQSTACYGASAPTGYTANNIGTDCDDYDAEINPNHVEVLDNGIDDNCDGNVDEVAPTSSLQPNQCGITLTSIWQTLYANVVTGATAAQGFRFEVTEVANPANVRTYDSASNRFNLNNLVGGGVYNTTYSIRVAVKTAPGFWRAYASACNVSTPAVAATTKVQTSQCGITLTNIAATLYCDAVTNATGYRFRITDGVTTQTYSTTVNRFSLTSSPLTANYATTYAVDVQLKFGTTWETTWGTVCNITTPATPGTSNVSAAQCGINIANLWATIYANQVAVATGYRFEVTKSGGGTVFYDTPNARFSLRNITVPGFTTTNASYIIRVSLLYNSIYQAFGSPCTITTNGASRITNKPLEVFEVNAYPNPFANNFKLEVNTSSEENVSIKVYDMLGRAIEVKQGNLSDMTSSEIGDQLTSGVYNVIVTQGEHVKTLRMIKR